MARVTHACVRRPGPELAGALSREDRGRPDFDLAERQHAAYVSALREAGVQVQVLAADSGFPDGCFVEDTHLVLPEATIRLRPGAPSRAGEPDGLRAHLPTDRPYLEIPPGAEVDGGDVLRLGRTLWVGLSGRTGRAAVDALAELLRPLAYQVKAVPVGTEFLHLKSGVSGLSEDLVVASRAYRGHSGIAAMGAVVVLPEGEDVGANVLVVNDTALIPPGCPTLRAEIERRCPRLRARPIDLSEFNKVDGMLTCLSLVW